MEMSPQDIFKWQFDHSVTYPIALFEKDAQRNPKKDGWLTIWNVQPWQWTCLGLMLVVFLPVVGSFKKGQVGWFTRVMRGFCLWVRDEMVYSVMGKEEGRRFAPFFLFMFFFIVFIRMCLSSSRVLLMFLLFSFIVFLRLVMIVLVYLLLLFLFCSSVVVIPVCLPVVSVVTSSSYHYMFPFS